MHIFWVLTHTGASFLDRDPGNRQLRRSLLHRAAEANAPVITRPGARRSKWDRARYELTRRGLPQGRGLLRPGDPLIRLRLARTATRSARRRSWTTTATGTRRRSWLGIRPMDEPGAPARRLHACDRGSRMGGPCWWCGPTQWQPNTAIRQNTGNTSTTVSPQGSLTRAPTRRTCPIFGPFTTIGSRKCWLQN
jgi:hypothetical protein